MKLPRRGLWFRQFLYIYLIAVVAIAAMTLIITSAVRQYNVRQREECLRQDANLVAEVIGSSVFNPAGSRPSADSSAGLQALVKRLDAATEIRITIIDTSGNVLADSRADPRQMENHRYRPEVIAALEDSIGFASRTSRTLSEDLLYVAVLKHTPSGVYLVRTSVDQHDLQLLLTGIDREVLLGAAVLLVLALAASFTFARTITAPLQRLTVSAERIAAGQMAVSADAQRRDEIGRLAASMNTMAEQIRKLFARVETEKERLQAIIGSMTEGVVVLDRERRVTMANASFRQIFSIGDGGPRTDDGRRTTDDAPYLWEVIRNKDFHDAIEQVGADRTTTIRELRVGDRSFSATAVLLKDKSESIVVVLHDITQLKDLERVKADLIANVSHELRTPLTAIKGFAETLGSETRGSQRRFLEIIERNTNRLISLVDDLLTISRLEREGQQLELELLDLSEVANDALRIVERRADEKGLQVSINAAPDTPRVNADRFLIEQLLINLLDNATKYTQQGEITVRIGADAEGPEAGDGARIAVRGVRIEVSDTGIGIPPEHLPRIFERFYVVDKNRSRELGGTGLGLAIVKHIVLAHGGAIEVKSTVGQGTTFTVLLPV